MESEFFGNSSDLNSAVILAIRDGYREKSLGSVIAHAWRSVEELAAGKFLILYSYKIGK